MHTSSAQPRHMSQPVKQHPGSRSTHVDESVGDLLLGLYTFLESDPHARRTAWLAFRLAQALCLDRRKTRALVAAAATHDIGKFLIPTQIRDKAGRLGIAETVLFRHHTRFGKDLLHQTFRRGDPWLDIAIQEDVAFLHHERWDGHGYPLQLAAEQIPLMARITSVADVFDALTSARSYKPAWSVEQAVDSIIDGRETQFDPNCVDAFTTIADELIREWLSVSDQLSIPHRLPPTSQNGWLAWVLPASQIRRSEVAEAVLG